MLTSEARRAERADKLAKPACQHAQPFGLRAVLTSRLQGGGLTSDSRRLERANLEVDPGSKEVVS